MPRYARRRAPVRRRRPSTRRPAARRSRFTRKRFARNNINQLTMRAPLASRLLRVKLPWVKTFDQNVAGGGSNSWAFQGNAICPYTVAGQTAGTNAPAAGDSLPAGEVEYSALYDRYFINGSSIKIEAINSATVNTATATQVLRCVLLAIPFVSSTDDSWQANKAQLDAYTYEQLLAWPFAKWRMIGISSGGAPRLTMKMFRKTKAMCGIKDLRDNAEYGSHLNDGTLTPPQNPQNGFMYYFRVFNNLGTTATTVAITVRMSLYCTLTDREFNPIRTITI